MPIYSVKGPDGRIYEVEGPAGASEEQLVSAVRREYLMAQPSKEGQPESGFTPALKAGFSGLKSGIAALAGKTGIMNPAAAEQYIAEQEKYQQQTFKPTATFGEAPLTKTAELLGGSLPYMAAPIIAGGAAAAAPVAAPIASALGIGAAGLASAGQFTGSNLIRQMQGEGPGSPQTALADTSLGSAFAAAVPQAALDAISFKMLPGVRQILTAAGKEVTPQLAKKIAEQGVKEVAKDYALATGKAMGTEGLTEAGQQFLERMQAGLSLTDAKARDEYWDSLVGGVVLGGALSPAGRYVERRGEAQQQEAARLTEAQRLRSEETAKAEAEVAKRQTPEGQMAFAQDYEARQARLKELQAIKKPGKNATPLEYADYAEVRKELQTLRTGLNKDNTEYRAARDAVAGVRAEQERAATAAAEARLAEIEGTAESEAQREPYYVEPQGTLPGMEAAPNAAPAAPAQEPVNYAAQIRNLEGRIDELRTRAQGTTSLDEKLALNKEFERLNAAIREAELAKKEQDKQQAASPEAKIASLRRRMVKAEEEGDLAAQAKIAAQLKELGVTDLAAGPEQGSFELFPHTPQVESKESFAERTMSDVDRAAREEEAQRPERMRQALLGQKPGEALLAAMETQPGVVAAKAEQAREEKIRPEVEALRRIGKNYASTATVKQGQVSGMVDKLVDAALRTDAKTTGRVVAGVGAAPLSRADALRGELALARATDNRARAQQIVEQLKALGESEADTGGDVETGQELKQAGVEGRLSPEAIAANRVMRMSQAQMSAYDRLVDYLQTVRESDQNVADAKKQTLQDAADRIKDSVVGLALNEMDARRAQAGMPELTADRKLEAVKRINGLLDELIRRSAGLFNGVETPAVTRGTLTLKSAKTGAPPAGQRLFGNMAMAANALRGQVRDVIDEIGEIKAPEPRKAAPVQPRVANEMRKLLKDYERKPEKQFDAAFDRAKSDEDYRTLKDIQNNLDKLSDVAREEAMLQVRRVETGQPLEIRGVLKDELADLARAGQSDTGQAELFTGESERGVSRATTANFMRFLNSAEVKQRRAKIDKARKQAQAQAKQAEAIERKLEAEAKTESPVETARKKLASAENKNREAVRIAREINSQRFQSRARIAGMVRQLEMSLEVAQKKEAEINDLVDYIVQEALVYPRDAQYQSSMGEFLDQQTAAAKAVATVQKALDKARALQAKVLEDQASDTIDNKLLAEGAKAQSKIDKAQQELKAAQEQEAGAKRRLEATRQDQKGKPNVTRTVQADGGTRTVVEKDGRVTQDVTRYTYAGTIDDEPQDVRVERNNLTGETEAFLMVGGRPVGDGLKIGRLVSSGMSVPDALKRTMPDSELEFKPATETKITRVYRDTSNPEVQAEIAKQRKNIGKAEEAHAKAMTDGDETAMAEALKDVEAAYDKMYEELNNAPMRREDSVSPAEVRAMEEFDKAQRAAFEKTIELFQEKAGIAPLKLTERRTVASVKNAKTGRIETQFKKESVAAQEKRAAQEAATGNYPARALEELAKARAELKVVQDQIAYIDANPAAPRSPAKARQTAARTAAVAKRKQLEAKVKALGAAQKEVVAEARVEKQAEKALKQERRKMLRNEEGPALYRTGTTGGKGVDYDALNRLVTAIVKDWENVPNIVTVETFDALPADIKAQAIADNVQDVLPGLYSPGTNTVYLVAENLHSKEDVIATVAHEVAGHFGLRSMLGGNYAKTMNSIYDGNTAVREKADAKMAEMPSLSREVAVEEVLADMAEVAPAQQTAQEKSALAKVYEAIKAWFQRTFGDKVSDAAVQQIVANARRYVIEGGVAAKGDVDTSGPVYRKKAKYASAEMERVGEDTDKFVAKQKTVWQKITANTTGMAFATQLVDRFAGFERLAKYMEPLKGSQMMYYLRMYDQRMNFVAQAVADGAPVIAEKTRPDGRKEYVLESKEGANIKNVVQILRDAQPMVGNAEAVNRMFTMYLAALRADRVGLAALNFGDNVSQAMLDNAKAAVTRTPGLKEVFDKARNEYNAYNKNMIQFVASTGAMSQDVANRLSETNDYIPFYREQNGNAMLIIGGENPVKIGNIAEQPYLQELVGGDTAILDFMTSSVQNTNMLVDMGLRNLATKNAVFELIDLGAAKIVKGAPSGADVVKFKVDGAERYAVLDTESVTIGGQRFETGVPADLLVKGMEGIPTQMPALLRAMAMPSQILRKAVTLSPLYMAKQLFRDSLAAPIISGADFKPVFGALKEVNSATKKVLERRGVTGGQQFSGTSEDLTKILRDIADGKPGWMSALSKAEALGMEADAVTRRAQYNSYIKQGLSEMEATLLALESMNFNKRGASPSVHMANALIPFMNAQIQGLNVLYKAFAGKMPFNDQLKIRQKLLQRGGMLAAATLIYAAMKEDDDDYKNARPDEKYGNWFIRIPGVDESVRVPVPFEIGYIFKAVPEALYSSMTSKHGGEEAVKAFKQILLQTVPGGSSLGVPQALKPAIEAGLGKSFYTGRDILSAHEKTLLPEEQFRANTSEMAKLLGKAGNFSPIIFENLVRGYTGTIGIAFLHALSLGAPKSESPEAAVKRLSDYPIVGGAFQPNDAGGISNSVYERFNEDMQVRAAYKKMADEGRIPEATALLQRRGNEIMEAELGDSFKSNMTKLTQAERAIAASNMSADEKRRQLDAIRKIKTGLAVTYREVADRTTRPQPRP